MNLNININLDNDAVLTDVAEVKRIVNQAVENASNNILTGLKPSTMESGYVSDINGNICCYWELQE